MQENHSVFGKDFRVALLAQAPDPQGDKCEDTKRA